LSNYFDLLLLLSTEQSIAQMLPIAGEEST